MARSLGPIAGSLGTTNAAVMLVTMTLPATVTQCLGQAALMTAGGLVQAALVVLFPIRRWGGTATRSPPRPTTLAGCARTPPPPSPLAPSPRPGRRPRSVPASSAAARLRALLRDVADTARGDQSDHDAGIGPAAENRRPDGGGTLVRPPLRREAKDAVRTARGQLHRDSPVFRHAVRATVVVVLGDLIGRALP